MTQKLFAPEDKPWVVDNSDPRLAPSSYAATAVFGITEMAVAEVAARGLELTAANIGRYARAFAGIIVRVQIELGSGGGWAASLNTRLRGALHTALEVIPPYDETDQDTPAESWGTWIDDLQRLTTSIAKTAAWLYSKKPSEL